ncbi:MAG: Gfo/Idh/MocA family oxidoreductase [Gemmatimonadaceae bacterium]|nr:Gfo/Idh/MocA family oxidoreductase [Gemmatimonadaceae bacterium]
MVRLAVIGCGRIAELVHLPALVAMPEVRIVAIADPEPTRRNVVQRFVPGARAFADAETLLAACDVDGVVICVPSGEHATVAAAAFTHGRHVYLEKPIATTADDGTRVERAWQRARTVGMTGFNVRFHPLIESLAQLLRNGAVGEVLAVRTVFGSAARSLPPWKQRRADGGGVLLDLASHHVDLVPWLLGTQVRSVSAVTRSVRHEDDAAALQLECADGVVAQLLVSAGSRDEQQVEVVGSRATVRVVRGAMRQPELVVATDAHPRWTRLRRALGALDPRLHVVAPWRDPSHARALATFVAAIRGAPLDYPTIADGRRSLEVVLAAEQSAATGVRVACAPPLAAEPMPAEPMPARAPAPAAPAGGARS